MRGIGILAVIVACIIGALVFFGWVGPALRGYTNTVDYAMNKVDEATRYELKKKVEDECRTMVASYVRDELQYTQNKDNEDKFYRDLAQQSKIRANSTAATYNEYILKNTFVFSGNVPSDIKMNLPYIE